MPDGKKSPTRGGVTGFVREVRFARNRVLLLLHERFAGVPGLADLVAGDVVAALELVEDERVELRRIDLAVFGQHGFIRDDFGDLPDDAVHRLSRYDLSKTAFHRDGELVDHRRVDRLRHYAPQVRLQVRRLGLVARVFRGWQGQESYFLSV